MIFLWVRTIVLHLTLATASALALAGCASLGLRHTPGVLLIAERDFAQMMLAQCEGGIEVSRAVESMEVNEQTKALAISARRDHETDRTALASWIAMQATPLTRAGEVYEQEIRTSHREVVSQLSATQPAALDQYATRLFAQHRTEEIALIDKTPLKDKELRQVVEAIRGRLSAQSKAASRQSSNDLR